MIPDVYVEHFHRRFRSLIMEDFDMDAEDPIEQENNPAPEKKSHQPSGIAMDALHGLLDSYSTADMKVRPHLLAPHENESLVIECSSTNSSSSSSTTTTTTTTTTVGVNNSYSCPINQRQASEYAERCDIPSPLEQGRNHHRACWSEGQSQPNY